VIPHGFIGDPPEWEITLHLGQIIRCTAHSYTTEDDEYVFSLFFDGAPPVQFKILRVPAELVKTVYG